MVELVQRINTAAEKGTWQAAAWMLERRDAEDFATNKKEVRELLKEVRELCRRTDDVTGKNSALPT